MRCEGRLGTGWGPIGAVKGDKLQVEEKYNTYVLKERHYATGTGGRLQRKQEGRKAEGSVIFSAQLNLRF